MATTYKGDYRTIADAITPATVLDPGTMGGKTRVMFDTITMVTGALPVADDTVELGANLPKGARVMDIMFWCSDAATTWTIGDAEDPDRYHAGTTANTLEHMEAYAGMMYQITDLPGVSPYDSQILATAVGATVTTASVIKFWVTYSVE